MFSFLSVRSSLPKLSSSSASQISINAKQHIKIFQSISNTATILEFWIIILFSFFDCLNQTAICRLRNMKLFSGVFMNFNLVHVTFLIHFVSSSNTNTTNGNYNNNNYESSIASTEDLTSQTQIHDTVRYGKTKETEETVCSESKVSYEKLSMRHKWYVRGLADYIFYLEKFQAPFELSSQVKFNSTPYNGTWNFKLLKSNNSLMELRACYVYESQKATAEKIAFDIGVTLGVEDDSVQLPLQISTQAANTGHSYTRTSHPVPTQVTRSEGDSSEVHQDQIYIPKYEWTHIFMWTDIQIKLQSLIESSSLQNHDVDLGFLINSYIPRPPESMKNGCETTNSKRGPGSGNGDGLTQIKNTFVSKKSLPPFYEHLNAIMADEKYADLIIKTGDEEYKVHRVILANSSPAFATMVFNKTFDKNESLIDLGEEIGADVVEEIIRYIYTGKVEDVDEIAERLIVAANNFALPNLKKFCEAILIQQVRMENAFTMYALGNEVESPRLRRKAFNTMKENKGKIATQSEEFRALSVHYPNLMYELFLS